MSLLRLPQQNGTDGGLHYRNLFCHSSRGLEVQNQLVGTLVSPEASLLGLQMAFLSTLALRSND